MGLGLSLWDYRTLAKFATNEEGKVIPKGLVKKMNHARYFGQASWVAQQLAHIALSFDIYNRESAEVNLVQFEQNISERYSPWVYNKGAHMHASFGHLAGYGAKYYTYQ